MSRKTTQYLAVDLGASSGRVILGELENGSLSLKEISRFPNQPVELGGRLFWDFACLWQHLVNAIGLYARDDGRELAGLGVDTWGVDFGLLGDDGCLLGNPVCYRDPTTEGIEETIASAVDPNRFYGLTGMAISRIGTLPQLCVMRDGSPGRLRAAKTLLMMPDLFRYFLCGHKAVELTSAGSSLLTNVRRGTWCPAVFAAAGLPRHIMPGIIQPGTVVGSLRPSLKSVTGLSPVPIVAVAGHDTLSAAAAAPYADDVTGFLSCGTWAVLGALRKHPLTSADAMRKGFVNELGVESVLLAKNMTGLYLFENFCRSLAARGRPVSYAAVIKQASQAKPFNVMVDPEAPVFFASSNPVRTLNDFLQRTGQKAVRSRGAVARALLEGLVWTLRTAVAELSSLTGKALTRLCLVGGGSRNALLCQMTADATGLEVIAGPQEATVLGNVGLQAVATGGLPNVAAIREMVRRSFAARTYRPRSKEEWDRSADRYFEIREKSQQLT